MLINEYFVGGVFFLPCLVLFRFIYVTNYLSIDDMTYKVVPPLSGLAGL